MLRGPYAPTDLSFLSLCAAKLEEWLARGGENTYRAVEGVKQSSNKSLAKLIEKEQNYNF